MGRPSKSKRDHRTSKNLSIKKALLKRVDELRGNRSRSEFVCEYLESLLFSDKAYCFYELQQSKLKVAYWEYEAIRAEARDKNKQLKLMEVEL